ncbi:hypothetical protein [Lyngbya confervoides]|uniref:CopG family transcriptional regulator n=1 Tax=Lyngbya confervoides BDU141951 TaxID=1574623 RepID=A0ABD4T8W7_9CYAN|nr:hypothetical protein [Lyngbya confervoides]MCM1984715.1 hypothetical protein [Lyngbya confervoides BDU141951]
MQDKQKVTLYIPPELHRQLKIRSAVDTQSMSDITERALTFYLQHAEIVAEVEASPCGHSHQVHTCPACSTSVVLKPEGLVPLAPGPTVLASDSLTLSSCQLDPVLSVNS